MLEDCLPEPIVGLAFGVVVVGWPSGNEIAAWSLVDQGRAMAGEDAPIGVMVEVFTNLGYRIIDNDAKAVDVSCKSSHDKEAQELEFVKGAEWILAIGWTSHVLKPPDDISKEQR